MWKASTAKYTTVYLFFFSFMLLIHLSAQNIGQWDVLNEGEISGFLYSYPIIQFATEDIGWIAGLNSLYKTEDGGENWSRLPLNENWYFTEFEFLNETIGYAYGRSDSIGGINYIVKTEDGGISWMPVFNLPENYRLRDISFVDDTSVFAIGNDTQSENYYSWVMRSVNAGEIWEEVTPESPKNSALFYYSHFYNSGHGYIVGDNNVNIRILRTTNGGMSWEEQISDQFNEILELQIVNDSLIYFTASHDNDAAQYDLCVSTDTLKNWQVIQSSNNQIGPIHGFNENTILSFFRDSVANHLMKSTDRGLNWEIMKMVEDAPLSIYFTPQQMGFYIDNIDHNKAGWGRYSFPHTYFLYKSNNGGDSWILKNYKYPFTDIFFIDQNSGYVTGGEQLGGHGGSYGRLFRTNDGGKTWDFFPQVENGVYIQCEFYNREIGFIRSGKLFKTSDGGNTWIESYINNIDSTGFEFNVGDITFLNEQVLYAAGLARWSEDSSGAAIFRTTDSGENWDLVWKYPGSERYSYYLKSIHVVNSSLWAVGRSGIIVSSVESDSFRVIESNTELSLNDVFFSDNDHGWIAGGYFNDNDLQLILLKTIDGGETWTEKRDFIYQINDMYFADSLNGWAVGNDTSDADNWPQGHGVILKTSDGGDNWTVQIEDLIAPLTAVHFKDGYGWAVGGNGLVLRTEDGLTWVNRNTGQTYPDEFSLSQNHPNPFNPSTIIKFSILLADRVRIDLYNTLGQKVKTILHKKINAGEHEIEFEAKNLSSGIYYYQLQAGDHREVKKMILLK